MPATQKPLNRIGIFWYQFTPRKLPYHIISVNLVKFGAHGLSGFFLVFFFGGGGGILYIRICDIYFDSIVILMQTFIYR